MFKHCETRWWDTPQFPGHGTLIIIMHNPDIGPAVNGLHGPEEIHEMAAAGLAAGGTRGIEHLTNAIVGAEAYHRKLSGLHHQVNEDLKSKLNTVQALGGNAFATLRAKHDEHSKRASDLGRKLAERDEEIALLKAKITKIEAKAESPEKSTDAAR